MSDLEKFLDEIETLTGESDGVDVIRAVQTSQTSQTEEPRGIPYLCTNSWYNFARYRNIPITGFVLPFLYEYQVYRSVLECWHGCDAQYHGVISGRSHEQLIEAGWSRLTNNFFFLRGHDPEGEDICQNDLELMLKYGVSVGRREYRLPFTLMVSTHEAPPIFSSVLEMEQLRRDTLNERYRIFERLWREWQSIRNARGNNEVEGQAGR